MKRNIFACIVILYYPTENIKSQIEVYINNFDKLYLYDNSNIKSEWLNEFVKKENVIYLYSGVNKGISSALNDVVEAAYCDGYEYLVTMDQDSIFYENDIIRMKEKVIELQDGKTAIVTTNFNKMYWKGKQIIYSKPVRKIENDTEVLYHITSGNFLYLPLVKELFPLDNYFIAFVDYDLDFLLNRKGYRIIVVGECIISQQIGNKIKASKLLQMGFTDMLPIRYYYLMRNNLYFSRKFRDIPEAIKFARSRRYRYYLKLLLSEKCKITKIKMMYRGYKDFKKGMMGPMGE